MFGDIAGFTAWSSTRDPQQVFCLLETIYSAFDEIATKRGVFKVETIGDSYVAACGVPDPKPNHAIVMCRFARDCRETFDILTKELEKELGPDTSDLMMRFGLNSGPVTAGVLRGQKSRFQLFGDVVNTAARMESTGIPGKIQATQATVDYLISAGKTRWVRSREESVQAKGKGKMKTYWIEPGSNTRSTPSAVSGTSNASLQQGVDYLDQRIERLVDWNTDILAKLIRQIVARRKNSTKVTKRPAATLKKANGSSASLATTNDNGHGIVMDEVREVIQLPAFDSSVYGRGTVQVNPDSIELDPVVMSELRDFVVAIASSYLQNPFHNYEHCSHVTMSVVKLLGRIVSPDIAVDSDNKEKSTKTSADTNSKERIALSLHNQTYGITTHPMTQFACVFAAMIHDAGHTGVPNFILATEHPEIAKKYRNQSLAEQRSVDVAFELFLAPMYKNLRDCIFGEDDAVQEFNLFRQLVVNCVIATDIFDPQLSASRKARWAKAFNKNTNENDNNGSSSSSTSATGSSSTNSDEDELEDFNRKATIVIEHVLQVRFQKREVSVLWVGCTCCRWCHQLPAVNHFN